jgi:hypothetical protein
VPSVAGKKEKKVPGKKSLDFFFSFCYIYHMQLEKSKQFVERPFNSQQLNKINREKES